MEDIIESKGAKNTVGVVFVERRITALALYDYFRNRSEGIANGTWLRVKDTKFRRKITTDTSRLTFAPKMIRDNKKRLDLSSMVFQDMNFSAEELEADIMNDVLVDALPKGYDMKALLDIEPSPIEPSQYDISVNAERGEKHQTIRWLVGFCGTNFFLLFLLILYLKNLSQRYDCSAMHICKLYMALNKILF